jgi:hypothetical protein
MKTGNGNISPDILPKSGAGQEGTDTLVNTYKNATPGQRVGKLKSFRSFAEETGKVYTGQNGFYSWLNLSTDSLEDIIDYFPEIGFTPDKLLELHVTVMYSKTSIPVNCSHFVEPSFITQVKALGVDWWPGHNEKGYLVVKLDRGNLIRLHDKWKKCGAIPTFPDYFPHMTLMTPFPENVKIVDLLNQRLNEKPLELTLIQEQIQDVEQ